MTMEELTSSPEVEDYCLFYGYSIVWNRWADAYVFIRNGSDYKVKEGSNLDAIFDALRELPQTDVLAEYLEEIEYPEDEIQ